METCWTNAHIRFSATFANRENVWTDAHIRFSATFANTTIDRRRTQPPPLHVLSAADAHHVGKVQPPLHVLSAVDAHHVG